MGERIERILEVCSFRYRLKQDIDNIKKKLEDIKYPVAMADAELKAVYYYKREYSSDDSPKAISKLDYWTSREVIVREKVNSLRIQVQLLTNEHDRLSNVVKQLTEILDYWGNLNKTFAT
jgi:hypothetical protein